MQGDLSTNLLAKTKHLLLLFVLFVRHKRKRLAEL